MDTQLARAVANALWPELKRDRWHRHMCLRDLANFNPAGYSTRPGSRVTRPPSSNSVLVQHLEEWVDAILYEGEWPVAPKGAHGDYAIRLTRDAYNAVWEGLPGEARVALRMAYRTRVEVPFQPGPNRHGQIKLRRTWTHEGITTLVGGALEVLAHVSRVAPITEEQIEEMERERERQRATRQRGDSGGMLSRVENAMGKAQTAP